MATLPYLLGSSPAIHQAGTAIDSLLDTLEASTAWAKLDAFYVMVGSDRLVNRKNPGTYDLTLTGAAYVDGVGIVTDGVDDYINTNMNPATAGGNFTQNAASFGYWVRGSHHVSVGTPMGQFSTNGSTLNGRSSVSGTNNTSYRINQTSATLQGATPVTDHVGLTSCNRTNSTTTEMYKNGVSITGGTDQTSTALTSVTFKFGTANVSTFTNQAFGAGFIGGNLTAGEHLEIHNALATFWASTDAFNLGYKPEVYSWWADPIAELQDGRIVVGGAKGPDSGMPGMQSFMEINEADAQVIAVKRMQDIYPLDDHHVTVSKRLASGVRVAFMTGHGILDDGSATDHTLAYARSSTGRISDFGAVSTITNTMTKSNYGQLHQMASARVILDTNCDGDKLWGVVYSDNDGSSWTVAKPHVTQAAAPGGGQNQMYEKTAKVGDATIRFFNIPHPTNTQNNIRVAQVDTTSGTYSSGGTDFGSIYQAFGAALTDVTNLAAITAIAAGKSQRLLDVKSDGTMFLVVEFTAADGTGAEYFLYRLTGANYDNAAHWTKSAAIVSAGVPFWSSSRYYGGAVFARESHSGIRIYTAREASGTKYIERRDSSDNGASWVVTELKSSSTLLARPVSTGSSTIPVIWQRITSYTDFDTFSGASIEWQ